MTGESSLVAPGSAVRLAGESLDMRVRDVLLVLAELPVDSSNERAARTTTTGGQSAESELLALFQSSSCQKAAMVVTVALSADTRCGRGETGTNGPSSLDRILVGDPRARDLLSCICYVEVRCQHDDQYRHLCIYASQGYHVASVFARRSPIDASQRQWPFR